MSLPVKLPVYDEEIRDKLFQLILLDAKRTKYMVPSTQKPVTHEQVRHMLDILVGLPVRKFRDAHGAMRANGSTIQYAMHDMVKDRARADTIDLCSTLVVCGLSAGVDAWPKCYAAHVRHIGSFGGRLEENFHAITGIEDGNGQNYKMYFLKCEDTLAMRWNTISDRDGEDKKRQIETADGFLARVFAGKQFSDKPQLK